MFNRIVFTQDVLRIDEVERPIEKNPQRKNVNWIKTIFADIFKSVYSIKDEYVLYGDENGFDSLRWCIYSKIGLPYTIEGWAHVYEGIAYQDIIWEEYSKYFFINDLVIGYEMSPSMIDYFNMNNISYIDFAIHPIRYLPDYILGVRSNIRDFSNYFEKYSLKDDLFRKFANVSKIRSRRNLREFNIVNGSALFLGQMNVDASLIYKQKMSDIDDLKEALIELSMLYPKVYYKRHPHNKNLSEINSIIQSINNCELIDINVYDAFSLEEFSLITSMSSGSVYEAKYFDHNTKYFLQGKKDIFDINYQEKEKIYYPMNYDIFRIEFWEHLKSGSEYEISLIPEAYENMVKYTLNMKWGR